MTAQRKLKQRFQGAMEKMQREFELKLEEKVTEARRKEGRLKGQVSRNSS